MAPVNSHAFRQSALVLLALFASGCQSWSWPISSKWALDDPDYAAKYSEPYGEDKTLRMLKQSVDARHIHGKGGPYLSLIHI